MFKGSYLFQTIILGIFSGVYYLIKKADRVGWGIHIFLLEAPGYTNHGHIHKIACFMITFLVPTSTKLAWKLFIDIWYDIIFYPFIYTSLQVTYKRFLKFGMPPKKLRSQCRCCHRPFLRSWTWQIWKVVFTIGMLMFFCFFRVSLMCSVLLLFFFFFVLLLFLSLWFLYYYQ